MNPYFYGSETMNDSLPLLSDGPTERGFYWYVFRHSGHTIVRFVWYRDKEWVSDIVGPHIPNKGLPIKNLSGYWYGPIPPPEPTDRQMQNNEGLCYEVPMDCKAKEDEYDYVQDDLNFDAERERRMRWVPFGR